jgi:glycosyltransferase involved in cell wall biosynthesis
MAMGKAVVSTRVGVEGLPVRNGENLALADAPREFADAVIWLLRHPEERERLASNARAFVAENFSWEKAAKIFSEICLEAAGDGGRGALGAVRQCDAPDLDSFAAPTTAQPK